MSKAVSVEPIELMMVSDHVTDAAEEYRQAVTRHLDDFSDGVARWRGDASKVALQEAAARWGEHHAVHHYRVQALGDGIANATQRFVEADQSTGETTRSPVEGILRL